MPTVMRATITMMERRSSEDDASLGSQETGDGMLSLALYLCDRPLGVESLYRLRISGACRSLALTHEFSE